MKITPAALTLVLLATLLLASTPPAQAMMGGNSPMGNQGFWNFGAPGSSGANSQGNYAWMMGAAGSNGLPDWMQNPAMWRAVAGTNYSMPMWLMDPAQWQAATGGRFNGWMDANGDGVHDVVQGSQMWMNLTNGQYGGWMDRNGDGAYDGFQYMHLSN